MHEMSLCQGMFDLIERQRVKDGFGKIKRVVVELGALGHVEPSAFEFAFDAVSRGTVAEGAVLEMVEVPARAWCMICSRSTPLKKRGDACPDCNGYQLIVEQGEELRLKELEVV